MAFTINVRGTDIVFTSFETNHEVDDALTLVLKCKGQGKTPQPAVLFVGTPVTYGLVRVMKKLFYQEGFRVALRDNHLVEHGDKNAELDVFSMLRGHALIETRREYLACTRLVRTGYFDWVSGVLAGPDVNGLMAAMKAIGVVYSPEDGGEAAFDADADLLMLDGPRAQQVGLSPLGSLLATGLATLPPYNPANPGPAEQAKAELFRQFVLAVQGDPIARLALDSIQ